MAVAFDAVGPSASGQGGTTTPQSWTHTAVASNVAIVVGFGYGHAAGADGTVTVTCDGNPMTLLGNVENNATGGGNGGGTFLYGIANRSSGAHSMQVSVTGGAAFISLECGSVSYSGADLSSPFGVAVTNNGAGTVPAVTVTGTTSGNIVAGVASIGSNDLTNPATSRWVLNIGNTSGAGNAGQADKAAGGSVAFTWSGTVSDWWGAVGVEVKVPQAAPSSGPPLGRQDLPNIPVLLVSNSGWRGAGHSW